jgi:hypothetical protein
MNGALEANSATAYVSPAGVNPKRGNVKKVAFQKKVEVS